MNNLNGLENEINSTSNRPDYALKGKKLFKLYKNGFLFCSKSNYVILNYLDINIRKAQIYGLLGPSGCGKTTLLKCLLGLLDIDDGNIFIDNELKSERNQLRLDLKKLGYMPQNTCLFSELTISEIFFYFGKMYSMSDKKIYERENFLLNLLNLPNKNAFICNLSGGQARRTSFAISLLNNPRILILDEPTVGMDPILRKTIWDYLVNLTKIEKTTIIITTHYIEEARKADYLGFMRNGKIIEENTPQYLMEKYQNNILEEIFYSICSHSEINPNEYVDEGRALLNTTVKKDCHNLNTSFQQEIKFNSTKNIREQNFNRRNIISFNRILANIYKDALKCLRNKKLLLIQFLVPIIQITFFCLCIGRPLKDLPIGFIDNEQNNADFSFGKNIISQMDNLTLTKKEFFNFSDGYNELKRGNIWCLIEIDRNFSQEIIEAYTNKILPNKFSNSFHVYMDNTNHQISYAIRDSLLRALKNILDSLLKKAHANNKNNRQIEEASSIEYQENEETPENELDNSIIDNHDLTYSYPIVFERPVYGENEPVFTNFMAPGIALSVIFFISVASTASNFEFERRVGLTERAYLSGVRTIELLTSQLIIYSILMIIQVFLILGLLFGFLKLPFKGSLILLVALLLSQGFCGLSYGLSLASVFHGEETVIQVTLASFYPVLLMSGIIWPIEAQPNWLKNYLSQLLPLTYATDAFRSILEKDWNLANNHVFKGFMATYIWTIIFLLIFLIMFSHKSSFKNV